MAKRKQPSAPERLPGAEGECLNHEQEEIVRWFRKTRFRKTLVGGVDEVQLWKKLEELYGLYEKAIRAERARYDALLEQAGVTVRAAAEPASPSPAEEATGPGIEPSTQEDET